MKKEGDGDGLKDVKKEKIWEDEGNLKRKWIQLKVKLSEENGWWNFRIIVTKILEGNNKKSLENLIFFCSRKLVGNL